MKTSLRLLSLLLSGGFLAQPLSAKSYEIITPGEEAPVGNGTVRSFVRTDKVGTPLAIGFWLTAKALEGLPDHDQAFVMPLPDGVEVPPYKHLTLNWNRHGHAPDGIYNVPHFDFHFFMITPEAADKITCADADAAVCMQKVDSAKIPASYAPGPDGVPKMGWHWVDTTSPEFTGQPFSATFIYGFYAGELTFIEPMVNLTTLTKSVNFVAPVPLPAKLAKQGYYPGTHSIVYRAPIDSYWISLNNLQYMH
jgi:Domain of unknown function (DUF5602)